MSMGIAITMANRTLLLALAAGMLISCASAATPGRADDRGYSTEEGPIPVLVLGEDRGGHTLPRQDPAFRRVVTELQAAMAARGFRVVDEDAVAAGLGWGRAEGRDRLDLLEVAKLANASERASDRVRAAVLFRIEGSVQDLAYTTRVELHLSGEMLMLPATVSWGRSICRPRWFPPRVDARSTPARRRRWRNAPAILPLNWVRYWPASWRTWLRPILPGRKPPHSTVPSRSRCVISRRRTPWRSLTS